MCREKQPWNQLNCLLRQSSQQCMSNKSFFCVEQSAFLCQSQRQSTQTCPEVSVVWKFCSFFSLQAENHARIGWEIRLKKKTLFPNRWSRVARFLAGSLHVFWQVACKHPVLCTRTLLLNCPAECVRLFYLVIRKIKRLACCKRKEKMQCKFKEKYFFNLTEKQMKEEGSKKKKAHKQTEKWRAHS